MNGFEIDIWRDNILNAWATCCFDNSFQHPNQICYSLVFLNVSNSRVKTTHCLQIVFGEFMKMMQFDENFHNNPNS